MKPLTQPTLLWFGKDLRIADNPALTAAVASGAPVLPVFVWSPTESGEWRPGAASRWWLRRSLEALGNDLSARGSGLRVLAGPVVKTLERLWRETGATRIVWNRRDEPASIELEERVRRQARRAGLTVETCEAGRLSGTEIRTSEGQVFRKFTPFYRKFLAEARISPPLPEPAGIPGGGLLPVSSPAEVLARIDDGSGFSWCWTPGSAAARDHLDRFVFDALDGYAAGHDRIDESGTSRLSPHLAFGEISAREVWHAVKRIGKSPGCETFLRQLVWREFAHEQLRVFPHMVDTSLRPRFEAMPTLRSVDHFELWREGRTGYPLVDAGMRQLRASGWMHNRARMVTASFLVKHLGLPWQWGAHWFWDRLVDADLANNSMNWQWVAGCGIDSAPYYRIFNPTRQGEKFDPEGVYARRWVSELRSVPPGRIYGSREGGEWDNASYPEPVVDHESAREAALGRYAAVREGRMEVQQP
jgi:deoxyribodipyrimidine photo-lyase